MSNVYDLAKEVGLNPARDTERGVAINTTDAIEALFRSILIHCRNGEKVRVKNFGVFSAKVYKGRVLKSPLLADGQVEFPDQLVLRFSQSSIAKKLLNEEPKKGKKSKKGKKGKKTAKTDAAPKAKKTAKKSDTPDLDGKKSKKGKKTKKSK